MKKKLYLIGGGPGGLELVTPYVKDILNKCCKVYTVSRQAESYKELRSDIINLSYNEAVDKIIESDSATIGVLVSGDACFFSLASILRDKLSSIMNIEMINGLSSMQVLAAKFNLNYENFKVLSLHGRASNILGAVSYNKYTFLLTGGSIKVEDVCRELSKYGLGSLEAYVGEKISTKDELLIKDKVENIAKKSFSDMACIIIYNSNHVSPYITLKDNDFIRGKVPMTKEDIRWLSVSKLSPEPKSIIYDIGAGTGSVSFELAGKAFDGIVYAIEKNIEGINLINKNRTRTGRFNVIPILGKAPEILSELPAADIAFIGGSGGNIKSIIKLLLKTNPKIKFGITCITLETLTETLSILNDFGLKGQISLINISKSEEVSSYHMMVAYNPIFIIISQGVCYAS